MSGIKGWEKAVPIKRPDNLCATNFTHKAFIPSYEKQYCKPDMSLMVSMEYRRMWFEERAAWQVEAYPKIKKESVMKNLEDKWREKLRDKMKAKNKGKENTAADKKKPKKKYRNAVSKTDSGLGYATSSLPVDSLSREKAPTQAGSTVSNQEDVKAEPQEMGSMSNQNSRNSATENKIAQGLDSFISHAEESLGDQLSGVPSSPQPLGNELVAKCARCATFHPLREKCPGVVLCKDQAFRERMMRNMC